MWFRDLRYALRTLRSNPIFSLVAILILGIGIGGIATSFAIVDTFLLRPLPFVEPDRLIHLYRTDAQSGADELRFSLPMIDELAQVEGIEALGAYSYAGRNISDSSSTPEHVMVGTLTNNLLPLLGASSVIGRTFDESDGLPGSQAVVLLDHGLWQNRFGGQASILGSDIRIDGQPHTVIGIMPSNFRFPYGEVKLWVPTALNDVGHSWSDRNYQPVARLASGANEETVRTALFEHYRLVESDRPELTAGSGLRTAPLREALLFLYDLIRLVLLVILFANIFVLLIICANLANLMLARAAGRSRELALRTVFGADRRHLLRQLLVEGLVLSACGGVLGIGLAYVQTRAANQAFPEALFRASDFAIDVRVLAVTVGFCLAATLFFALLPALKTSRVDPLSAIQATGAGRSDGDHRLRSTLVVVQVSTAFVLLISTALMLRTVQGLENQDPGFESDNLLTSGIHLSQSDFGNEDEVRGFHSDLVSRMAELAEIRDAGLIHPLPLNFESQGRSLTLEGRVPQRPDEQLTVRSHTVDHRLFPSLGIPVIAGRNFAASDQADAPAVVIVDRTMAERYWPGDDPIGKRLRYWSNRDRTEWATVVGVVENSKSFFLNEEPGPTLFAPFSQVPAIRSFFLVARTNGAPSASVPAMRRVVDQLRPDLPLSNIRTMTEVIEASTLPWRGATSALTGLAALALVLATLGLYGVVAAAVVARIPEIGIRRALGASARDILRIVLQRSARLLIIGLAVGAAVAFALTQALSSLLFGIGSLDPTTWLIAILVLVLAALGAAALPLRRALRVDPIRALHYD